MTLPMKPFDKMRPHQINWRQIYRDVHLFDDYYLS